MKLRFITKKSEVPGVCSFIFDPSEPIPWQPGQYMHYVLPSPHPDERGVERWFTISSAPFEKHIAITTRFDGEKVSSFKGTLRNLEPGDEIEADGPKGRFILNDDYDHHILIAGGIGITPYRSMLAQLAHEVNDKNICLLYANRDKYFVFDEELAEYAKKLPNLTVEKFAGSKIELANLAPFINEQKALFYLSGPRPMVEAYESLLKEQGVAEERLKTDYFPGY